MRRTATTPATEHPAGTTRKHRGRRPTVVLLAVLAAVAAVFVQRKRSADQRDEQSHGPIEPGAGDVAANINGSRVEAPTVAHTVP